MSGCRSQEQPQRSRSLRIRTQSVDGMRRLVTGLLWCLHVNHLFDHCYPLSPSILFFSFSFSLPVLSFSFSSSPFPHYLFLSVCVLFSQWNRAWWAQRFQCQILFTSKHSSLAAGEHIKHYYYSTKCKPSIQLHFASDHPKILLSYCSWRDWWKRFLSTPKALAGPWFGECPLRGYATPHSSSLLHVSFYLLLLTLCFLYLFKLLSYYFKMTSSVKCAHSFAPLHARLASCRVYTRGVHICFVSHPISPYCHVRYSIVSYESNEHEYVWQNILYTALSQWIPSPELLIVS